MNTPNLDRLNRERMSDLTPLEKAIVFLGHSSPELAEQAAKDLIEKNRVINELILNFVEQEDGN